MAEMKWEGIALDDEHDPTGKLRKAIYSMLQEREQAKKYPQVRIAEALERIADRLDRDASWLR
jgi:2-keto-3-deoxy-L-rhamnonate aldolase RhmA